MRVATVDGLITLFYDGSKPLYNWELEHEWGVEFSWNSTSETSDECKEYHRERESWQQIIVIEGVTVIPENTFYFCSNIKRVIFANTVIRIERWAFNGCRSLIFVKWSMNLEYIGGGAFCYCNLSSVFISPRCREICESAFQYNRKLSIFHVPQDTGLGRNIVDNTALAEASPFEVLSDGSNELEERANPNMNTWLKNMNNNNQFALHRTCSSFEPLKEVIHAIIQEKGLKSFREENSAGITPSQYFKENPNNTLTEKEIIHEYLMKMIGEFE